MKKIELFVLVVFAIISFNSVFGQNNSNESCSPKIEGDSEMVFIEDFFNNNNRWKLESDKYKCKIENGKLFLDLKTKEDNGPRMDFGNKQIENFEMTYCLKYSSTTESFYTNLHDDKGGRVFYGMNTGKIYSGYYIDNIFKRDPTTENIEVMNRIDYTSSNEFKILKIGETFRFYINGIKTLEWKCRFQKLVGISLSNCKGPDRIVAIDYIRIKALKNNARFPDDTPHSTTKIDFNPVYGGKDNTLDINEWVRLEIKLKNPRQYVETFVEPEKGIAIEQDTTLGIGTEFKIVKNDLLKDEATFKITLNGGGYDQDTFSFKTKVSKSYFQEYKTKLNLDYLYGKRITRFEKGFYVALNKDNTFNLYYSKGNTKTIQKGRWSLSNRFGENDLMSFYAISPVDNSESNYTFHWNSYSSYLQSSATENFFYILGLPTYKFNPIVDDENPNVKKLNEFIIGKWVDNNLTSIRQFNADHTLIYWTDNINQTETGSWFWEFKRNPDGQVLCFLWLIGHGGVRGAVKCQVDLLRSRGDKLYMRNPDDSNQPEEANYPFYELSRNNNVVVPMDQVNMSPAQVVTSALLGIAVSSALNGSGNGDCKCSNCGGVGQLNPLMSSSYSCPSCSGSGNCK